MASTFASAWTARVLERPPLIAPARSFVWPQNIAGEEDALARGALYVLVRPAGGGDFLLTCALGFESPTLPRGVWACPNAEEICAVAGGYAYIANVHEPETPVLVEQRPVVGVRVCEAQRLLLFAGFHDIVAWGESGQVWRTRRLTDEGLTLCAQDGDTLNGLGWNMLTDAEVPFTVDLRTGEATGGVAR